MVNRQQSTDPLRQQLSALMDGELDPADWTAACDAWRAEGDLRAEWHAWHLIGDALRSDELASTAVRDRAFLAGFRERLAAEPVVLAPLVSAAAPGTASAAGLAAAPAGPRRLRWLVAPAAVAAGFLAVAAALLVVRSGQEPAGGGVTLAAASGPAGGNTAVAGEEAVREARLDRYLAAHRRLASNAAMAVPGGSAHNVDVLAVEAK